MLKYCIFVPSNGSNLEARSAASSNSARMVFSSPGLKKSLSTTTPKVLNCVSCSLVSLIALAFWVALVGRSSAAASFDSRLMKVNGLFL